jgi:hypothetical protein
MKFTGRQYGQCEEECAFPIVLGEPLVRNTSGTITVMSRIMRQMKRLRP